MPQPIRILLIDDHSLFRESLSRLLQAEPDLSIVGSCATAAEALDVMAREAAEALQVSRCIISEYTEGDDELTPLVAYEREPAAGLGGRSGPPPPARPSARLLLGRGTQVERPQILPSTLSCARSSVSVVNTPA